AVAALLSLAVKRSINWQIVGLFIVFLIAYALVSIPEHKSGFIGVIVSTFFLAFYVMACGSIIGLLLRLGRYGRRAAVGFGGALLLTSAAAFDWPWSNQRPSTSNHLEAARRYDLIRRVGDYLESHSDVYAVESIFFPAVSNYLNPANVLFELQKRRIKYEF